MADNFFKINKGLNLGSQATAPANPDDGDIYFDTILGLRLYRNSVWQPAGGVASPDPAISTDEAIVRWDGVNASTTQDSTVLISDSGVATGLSIDADGVGNVITNIENADIKVGAAIDAAKIHTGTVSNTEFGYLDGVTSAIQTQLTGLQSDVNTRVLKTGDTMTGALTFPNDTAIYWRNGANTADLQILKIDPGGNVRLGNGATYQHLIESTNGIEQFGSGQTGVGLRTQGLAWFGGSELQGRAIFGSISGSPTSYIGQSGDANKLHISVNDYWNDPQFTFTNTGRFGIGPLSPTAKLDIDAVSASVTGIKVKAATGQDTIQYLNSAGANLYRANFDGYQVHHYYGSHNTHNIRSFYYNFTATNDGHVLIPLLRIDGAQANPAQRRIQMGELTYANAVDPLTDMAIGMTTFAWDGISGSVVNSAARIKLTQLTANAGDARLDIGALTPSISVLTSNGNVGIGTTTPTARLSVGANNEFQVNSTGNIIKLNNITTLFPSAQGAASTVLTNDGSGGLSWAAVAVNTVGIEGNIGTLTWTATTAPSGTITQRYKYTKVEGTVTLSWRIEASIAGLAVTDVSFSLPGDVPSPTNFTNQSNDEWVTISGGAVLSSSSVTLVNGAAAGLYKNSGGVYEIRTYSGTVSVAAQFVAGTITYQVD